MRELKPMPGNRGPHRARTLLLLAALTLCSGCTRTRTETPYPHEFILTAVAELKIYLQQDPYRMAPGRDLEGHNIFRVSLSRLDALRSMTDAAYADSLDFARGQCLERLRDWEGASQAFEAAAAPRTSLEGAAREHAAAARRMAELTDRRRFNHDSVEAYLADLEVMDRRLLDWVLEKPVWPYEAYALLEAGRGREERIRILFDDRRLINQGAERAIAIAESLAADFQESYRVSEHWLLTGSLHEALARDWAAQFPPEGRLFDIEGPWSGWVEKARGAYRNVALADGDPCKPEGQARLRALDAYALRIQSLAQ